jgi:L-cysteine desulfidase
MGMSLSEQTKAAYLKILEEELVPAMGCTEPIAIALAAAKARQLLGSFPDQCRAQCSGHIIKNVRSVTIPGTGGLIGIEAAVWAGVVAGSGDRGLEVLSSMTEQDAAQVKALLASRPCDVSLLKSESPLHLMISVASGEDEVTVEIKHSHTNVVRITKNSTVLVENPDNQDMYLGSLTDRSVLNVSDICEFADSADLAPLRDLLERQIAYNMAIAEEGLKGTYGVGIGQMMLENAPEGSLLTTLKAYASAASEARMSGCTMPVVTNSGSGNQGIASSVPVIMFAKLKNVDHDRLLRALILSNLLTIHQKTLIGRLSAFCGMINSAAATGAAMTYLEGGSLEQINKAIANTLANATGIICDGAKPACGAKIAATLDAGYLGHKLAMQNRGYQSGHGILKPDIEKTIEVVGRVAHEGMRETEGHLLNLLLHTC